MGHLAFKSLACGLALGLCVVLGLVGPAAAQSVGNGTWLVLEKYGSVRFRPPAASKWSQAAVGAELPLGSRIVTDADGWVIIRHPAGNLWVEPNARFVLPSPNQARVRQELGNLRYRIIRTEQQRFEVETPFASLVVKGTAFEVRVTEAGVAVQVERGRVAVETPEGSEADLRAGQAARVRRGAAPRLEVRRAPGQAFEVVPPGREATPALAPAVQSSEIPPADRDTGAAGEAQGNSWFDRLRDVLLNNAPPTIREDWWGPGDGGGGNADRSSSRRGGSGGSSGSGSSSGSSGSSGFSGGSGSGGSGGSSGGGGSGGSGSGGDDDGDGDGDEDDD